MSKPVAKIIKDALKNKGYDFIHIRFCGANYHGPAEWYFKVSKLDMDFILKEADVESTDQCNTCVKTSYFDHFLVGNYGTHETVVYQAR